MSARAWLVAGALLTTATPACADDPPSPWSGSLTLSSNYVSRGFEQSWGNPALQAGLEYRHGSGGYVGTWASTVSDKFIENGVAEWDVYAGYARTHGDWSYGASLNRYAYPGAQMSATRTSYDYAEAMVSIGWKTWTLAYASTVSRDYFGINSRSLGQDGDRHSRGSGYLSLEGRLDLRPGTALVLHAGQQRVRHFSDYDFRDGSIALQSSLAGVLDWEVGYARAWNAAGVYRNYTTGVVDAQGRTSTSHPGDGAWYVNLTRTF